VEGWRQSNTLHVDFELEGWVCKSLRTLACHLLVNCLLETPLPTSGLVSLTPLVRGGQDEMDLTSFIWMPPDWCFLHWTQPVEANSGRAGFRGGQFTPQGRWKEGAAAAPAPSFYLLWPRTSLLGFCAVCCCRPKAVFAGLWGNAY
jgi:hypothetical protein